VSGVEGGGAALSCLYGPVRDPASYSREEMTALLDASAGTSGGWRAALYLLVAAGSPGDLWFARHVVVLDGTYNEPDGPGKWKLIRRVRAWVRDWEALVGEVDEVFLDENGNPAGWRAVLVRLAASFAADIPVGLGGLAGLDLSPDVARHVLTATAIALGLDEGRAGA
jgi:hypothetical protein